MKANETTLEEPFQHRFYEKTQHFIFLYYFLRYLLHLQRRLSRIMEAKGLKLSSSFYFADYVELRSSFKQQIFAKIYDY